MAELTHENIGERSYDRLSQQFASGQKVYHPDFDFYKANEIHMIDEDGNRIKQLSDDQEVRHQMMELENRLSHYAKNMISMYENSWHPEWIQNEKDYQMDSKERKTYLKKMNLSFMSNYKQPIIRTKVDKVATGLFTQNYTIKAYAHQEKNKNNVQTIQNFITRCFGASKTRQAVLDAALDAVKFGVGYVRTGFRNINSEVIEKNKGRGGVFEPDAPYPYAKFVDPFCIYADPARDFYDQPIMYRDFFPIKTIEKEKAQFFKLSDNQRALILGNPQPFSYANHKKVRLIKALDHDYDVVLNNFFENNFHGGEYTTDFRSDREFYQVELNNDVCEYVERWSGENLVIAINGYIVYDGPNPLPTGRHPFHKMSYTRVPGMWMGDGIASILKDIQRMYDVQFNAMFDMAKMKAAPMFVKSPGQNFEGMGDSFQYAPWRFVKSDTDQPLTTLNTPSPSEVNFSVMNDLMNMVDFAVSPTSYNELQGVSRSATDSEYRQKSLRDALRPLSENINDMFGMLVDDWLLYAKSYMPEKFRVLISTDNKTRDIYKTINREMLEGNYLFETEFESLKDVNRSLERAQATEFLQSIQMIMKDPVDGSILINMPELVGYITELYSKNNDFSLDKDEFYERLKEGQKKMMEIQSETMPPEQAQMQGTPQPQGVPGQQVASEVASDSGVIPEISELLKGVNGG